MLDENSRTEITNIMCQTLGQARDECLERCKKLVAQKSAQDFELNTLSRSRDVKEEGYEHRIFVPSEKAQWTVAFPAYPDMSQDYTRELPNGGGEYFLKPTVAQKSPKVAPTAIDERTPAKSLAMKKIMMTKPRPGRGGGIVWPSMLQAGITPWIELFGVNRSVSPHTRPRAPPHMTVL